MSARKQLGLALVQRFTESRPPPDFAATIEDLRVRLRDIAAKCTNRANCEFFGGLASGFVKNGSDADVSLTYSGYTPLLQGLESADEHTKKKMMTFGKTAADHGMVAVRYVASRIPVVQFVDPVTDITCDVSVGNCGGIENSRMLRRMHDVHPVVGLYVFAVKEWAKQKEVISPEKGCFNSFTVTTMALMVLQELRLLPVFTSQTGLFGEATDMDVGDALAKTPLNPALAGLDANNAESMADAVTFLLSKFAEYYAAFDFERGVVSLTHPRQLRALYHQSAQLYLEQLKEAKRFSFATLGPVDENELSEAMSNEEKQRPSTTPFVVVDIANYVNCGRRVSLVARKNYVLDEFRSLRTMLNTPDLTLEQLLRPTSVLKQVVTDFDKSGDRRVTRFN